MIASMKYSLAFAPTLLLALTASGPKSAAQQTVPESIPSYDTLTINSPALGESRRINVHLPKGYAESRFTRFPVLYMPDGGIDEDFPHVVNTVDSLIALRQIRPVIVVGVPNTERRRDLTGPTRVHSDSAIAPHVGGSAEFRRFFHDELIPEIERRYRTTSERAIVGESLAGLFIVETFLRERTLFDHYIAFDPSLWWNHGALVDSAPTLLRASSIGYVTHRTAGRRSRRNIYIAASRDDIDDQTERLAAALRSGGGFAWTHRTRTDLTHATIFRALVPDGLLSTLR